MKEVRKREKAEEHLYTQIRVSSRSKCLTCEHTYNNRTYTHTSTQKLHTHTWLAHTRLGHTHELYTNASANIYAYLDEYFNIVFYNHSNFDSHMSIFRLGAD